MRSSKVFTISMPRRDPSSSGTAGLAAQLLNVVVGFERPDLEEMRQKLVQQMSDNRQVIKSLEDTCLNPSAKA